MQFYTERETRSIYKYASVNMCMLLNIVHAKDGGRLWWEAEYWEWVYSFYLLKFS